MKTIKYLSTTIFIVIFILQSYMSLAQTTISGELRPRTEYRHGYGSLADSAMNHGIFTDQRTRLNFDHKTEGYAFRLSVQDIRTWGSQAQQNITDGLSSVHEAWGEAIISKKFSLKLGRQEIIYDDHRIFGNVGWAQQARSHDAAIIKYQHDNMKIHAGFAYNQDKPQSNTTLYTVSGNYKALQYLWVHKDFKEKLGVSLLFLNNGMQASYLDSTTWLKHYKDNYSQTIGTRITYKMEKAGSNIAFYYQTGIDSDWGETYIDAYLGSIDIFYKPIEKLTATIGYEMQTGNSQTAGPDWTKDNHAFTPFYGTNHKFNGHMDYFYAGNHINSVGLQDIFLKLKYGEKDKGTLALDVHNFMSASNILDPVETQLKGVNTAMNSSLGTEIDFSYGFNLSKGVKFKLGYSHMIAAETMEVLMEQRGSTNPDIDELSNWAWAMVVIKPVFYTNDKK